jgi:hypothetical protein
MPMGYPSPAGAPYPPSTVPPIHSAAPSGVTVWLWGGVFGFTYGLTLAFANSASNYTMPLLLFDLRVTPIEPTVLIAAVASTGVLGVLCIALSSFLAALVAKHALAGLVAGVMVPLVGALGISYDYLLLGSRYNPDPFAVLLHVGSTIVLLLIGASLGLGAGLLGRAMGRKRA